MLKIKDYNKKYLHKWTTLYEAMKIHLRHVLYMLYSCTKAAQPLRAQAIKLLMHTVPPHPNCRAVPPPARKSCRDALSSHQAPPPQALLSLCRYSLHYTRGAADFSRVWLSRDFQGAPVNGLQHARQPRRSARRSRVQRRYGGARQLSAFSEALGWGNFMFMRPKRATKSWPATREAMANSLLQCTEGPGGLNLHEYALTTSLCLLLKLLTIQI